MYIETKENNGITLVNVSGRMDATTTQEFEKRMDELISNGAENLLMDFSKLEYISSAGLRALLATAKRLKAADSQLLFCNLTDTVKEIFEISGFDSIFKVFETADAALASLA